MAGWGSKGEGFQCDKSPLCCLGDGRQRRGGARAAALAGARHQLLHRPPAAAAGRGRRARLPLHARRAASRSVLIQ